VSKVKGKTREEVINNLAERIDKFEQYTTPHSQAMADMARHLARRLGLSQADAAIISEAARLHDIGLLAMAPAYHGSPAAPRFEERLDLWRHSIIGEQEMAKREASRYAQLLVRWHHEWWNGSGYPDMLAFEDIPIGARILRAVELYNALTSDRPYRSAFYRSEAVEVLKSSAGIECDPYVVHALLALLEAMQANEAPAATVIPDQALTTSILEEVKAEDAVATVRLNPQTANPEDAPSSSLPPNIEEAISAGGQQSGSNIPEPPSSSEAYSPISVWSDPPPTAHSTPQEASQPPAPSSQATAQTTDKETTVTPADQPSARRADDDLFLQSANPLDALDDLPAAADVKPVADTSPMETPLVEQASSPYPSSTANLSSDMPAPSSVSPQSEPSAPLPQDAKPASPAASTAEASQASHLEARTPSQATVKHSPAPQLLSRLEPQTAEIDDSPNYLGWQESGYNQKSLLAFEASVLRQIQFSTIAIPFTGEAKLDWYLKAWGKRIFSNDARAWAATVARAMVESTETLSEETITQLLTDIYIPGTRLTNSHLRRWFSETDAWWMDNLRRNIETLEDDKLRAQACLLGLETGDYALSFSDETADLRRPLTTVFWRLAGRFTIGALPHAQNRSYNYQPLDFIRNVRSDLLFLNLPASHQEKTGAPARSEWRECWVKGLAADAEDFAQPFPASQSKQTYLLKVDKMLSVGAHIKKWAIACQESGLVSAREINELVKEHRNVRATYSKDVTEVAGGLRHFIIVAERE
jgi:hypothetical protein